MKNLLLATALMTAPLALQAQESVKLHIEVPCGETNGYHSGIAGTGLRMLMTGPTTITDATQEKITGTGQVFLHPDNGSLVVLFTAPVPQGPNMSCALMFGQGFTPYTGTTPGLKEDGDPA